MTDQEFIEDLQEEQEFDLELIGNFGRFVSGNSYPVEYFMTTMPIVQAIRYLSFARDLQMDDINFDLLMQRDIDEGRVEDEILPYLQQDESVASQRPLFFPPLLAAIVPVEDEKLDHFYGKKEKVFPRKGFVGSKWAGNFQIQARKSSNSQAIRLFHDEDEPKIAAKQTLLSLRTSNANSSGVMLIVIDGQHRLMALRRLKQEHYETVKDLVVPVCVMYPPNSHAGENPKTTPTVPRVFRNLFVDVNSTMKRVGGHFNILLSDKNVGDITCRVFCDSILDTHKRTGLAAIEWNTRTPKESYNVTKKHTLTSIGIIQRALADNFKTDTMVRYLLEIDDASSDLFPSGADADEYYPTIKWDRFSYAQSNAIKKRAQKFVAPLLTKLFFESVPYRKLWEIHKAGVEELKAEQEAGGQAGIAARAVLQQLLEYKPIPESEPAFKARYNRFGEYVEEQRKAAGLDIVRYALFQRALMNVAGWFLRQGYAYNVEPSAAFDTFVKFVNRVFERNVDVFNPENRYLQYTVFNQKRIRTREDSRLGFRDLLFSHLLCEDVRESAVFEGMDPETHAEISNALHEKGFSSAGELLSKFREERAKAFKREFELDYSIGQSERSDLKMLEMRQREHEREVKDNKRQQAEVDRSFDKRVNDYVEEYVQEAKKDLINALGIKNDLLEVSEEEDSGDDEEA